MQHRRLVGCQKIEEDLITVIVSRTISVCEYCVAVYVVIYCCMGFVIYVLFLSVMLANYNIWLFLCEKALPFCEERVLLNVEFIFTYKNGNLVSILFYGTIEI